MSHPRSHREYHEEARKRLRKPRPSIRKAAEIIALNDEWSLDLEHVATTVSVAQMAWLFEIEPTALAKRIIEIRKAHQNGENQ